MIMEISISNAANHILKATPSIPISQWQTHARHAYLEVLQQTYTHLILYFELPRRRLIAFTMHFRRFLKSSSVQNLHSPPILPLVDCGPNNKYWLHKRSESQSTTVCNCHCLRFLLYRMERITQYPPTT